MTSPLDLDAISQKWLQPCGSCDAGLPTACTHPSEDYRPVMLALVREVEQLRAEAYLDRIYADRLRAANPLEQRANMALLTERLIAEVKEVRAANERISAGRMAAIEQAEMSGATTLAYERQIERMRPVVDAAKAWADSGILRQGGPPMAEVLAGIEPAKQQLREAVAAYRKAGA